VHRAGRAAGLLAAVLTLAVTAPAQAAQAPGFDAGRFASPPPDSRPTILWYWNGTVTPELVDRQMAEMRAKGIDEAVLFPFATPALRPAVFSEGWFAIVEHTLREAQRTGMKLWLFNDDYYPSGRGAGLVVNGGTVGGRVLEPHPELRTHGLTRTSRVVTGPADVRLRAQPSGLAVVDGRLVVDAASVSGVAVLDRGTDWGDYTVTARARVERARAGLIVRASDERNGYLVDYGDDGVVEVWRQVDGGFSRLMHTQVAGFDAQADHDLRVTVTGDTIAPFLDGRALPVVHDATFPRGTVGVRAVATQRSTIDQLRVTDASGAPLYEQTFSDEGALDDFRTRPNAGQVVAAVARPDGSTDPDAVIDLSEQVARGEPWHAPAGRWRVDQFVSTPLVDDQPWSLRRSYLDLLDDEAVDRMMDAVPGEYYRRFKWAFGTVIKGFWDDEPMIASAAAYAGFHQLPWSRSLPAELSRLGTTPGRALASAFDDLGRQGRIDRGRYWRAVSNRFADAYYKRQAAWMADHGVQLISNPLWDEYGPAEQVATTGDALKDSQWAQVPGADVIFDQYREGGHTLIPRWAASAAHQNGQDRVLLEAFGGMGWGVTPQFAYATVGGFAVRGVNLTVLHAMWTNPSDVVFPPPFQPENPWWRTSRPLNDWIGRVMDVARAPAPARTVLIQPQRAAEAAQGTPDKAALDDAFAAAAYGLEDAQVDFDLLDESALDGDHAMRAPADLRGGRLRVGHADYRVAVLPEARTLAQRTAEQLTRFVRQGGAVVAVGRLPDEEADGHDAALRRTLSELFDTSASSRRRYGAGVAIRVPNAPALRDAARETGAAAATLSPRAPAVRVLRLAAGGDAAFLVNNESGRAVRTTATFPVRGTPDHWDPRTGRTAVAPVFQAHDTTSVPLDLGPYETTVVVFRHDAPPPAQVPHLLRAGGLAVERVARVDQGLEADVVADAPGRTRLIGEAGGRLYAGDAVVEDPLGPVPLDRDWAVRLEPDGTDVRRALGSWTSFAPRFSGAATYSTSVDLTGTELAGRRLVLDLGDVRDVAEVAVNGRRFGPLLWTPHRLDVTDALRAGSNAIAVTVTNTLANVHGDPRPSGLLGPVALRPQRPLRVRLSPLRDGAAYDVSADEPALAPGQARDVDVVVRRLGGGGGEASWSAAVDGGLHVTPTSGAVRLGRDAEAHLRLRLVAPAEAPTGSATLRLTIAGEAHEIPVRIDLASRLGTATASSTHPRFSAAAAIDGDISSAGWDAGGGWNDNTFAAFPDSLTVTFAAPATVGRVDLYTLDSGSYPAARYGIRDGDVQVLANGDWSTVGEIRGNAAGHVITRFAPVQAAGVRLLVDATNDGAFSRVIELEARPR
jgi:hypothetical protein